MLFKTIWWFIHTRTQFWSAKPKFLLISTSLSPNTFSLVLHVSTSALAKQQSPLAIKEQQMYRFPHSAAMSQLCHLTETSSCPMINTGLYCHRLYLGHSVQSVELVYSLFEQFTFATECFKSECNYLPYFLLVDISMVQWKEPTHRPIFIPNLSNAISHIRSHSSSVTHSQRSDSYTYLSIFPQNFQTKSQSWLSRKKNSLNFSSVASETQVFALLYSCSLRQLTLHSSTAITANSTC